jgi:hypothetical protein
MAQLPLGCIRVQRCRPATVQQPTTSTDSARGTSCAQGQRQAASVCTSDSARCIRSCCKFLKRQALLRLGNGAQLGPDQQDRVHSCVVPPTSGRLSVQYSCVSRSARQGKRVLHKLQPWDVPILVLIMLLPVQIEHSGRQPRTTSRDPLAWCLC